MSYNLKIIEEQDLTEQLVKKLKKLLISCFSSAYEKHSELLTPPPYKTMEYRAILLDGQSPVAHFGMVRREVVIDGKSYSVAGGCFVGVDDKYRGQKLVDIVSKAAVEEAAKRDFDFGMLFTRKQLLGVYNRTGWQDVTDIVCRVYTDQDEKFVRSEKIKMFYPLKTTSLKNVKQIDIEDHTW